MKPFNVRHRFFAAPLILIALAGFSFITMLLWNSLLPEIVHLPQISFWQAVGLLILLRLLFGFNFPWHGHQHRMGNHLREKWEHMNPEEREEFKKRLHQRVPFWKEQRESCSGPQNSENKNS
jgi:hypothetical protein